MTAYLEYPNGATGTFVSSTGEAPGSNRFEVAATAAKVLGNMGAAAKAAVPALRERLKDNDESVRATVKEALTNIEQSGPPPTGVR